MIRLVASFLLTFGIFAGGYARPVEPMVDQRAELMSVVAYLSGYKEYDMRVSEAYRTDVERAFRSYANHPLMRFMQGVKRTCGIGYDAVMSMAMHMELREGLFLLIDEKQQTLESRWANVDKDQFLSLLSDFYVQSAFHDFFTAHDDLHRQAVQAYTERVMGGFDQGWYADFYGGEPEEDFRIVLCVGCWPHNYGTSCEGADGRKQVFAVVGCPMDAQGAIAFDENHLAVLIHEFNHSFVNPLLVSRPDRVVALSACAGYLFRTARWCMDNQAYGNWTIMVNESLVRAAVICYMQDKGYDPRRIEVEIADQIARGFRWMPEMVALLRDYRAHRAEYPTLDAFYLRIIETFDRMAREERARIAGALSV